MFFGAFDYTLDAKGRSFLPSSIRTQVTNTLYIMKGYEGALSVYVEEDFQKRIAKLQELPFNQRDVRDVIRLELSSVVPLPLDEQGRILIPKRILDKYGIGRKIVIIGVLDHFEIWDKGAWDEYQASKETEFEDKSETISLNLDR